MSDQESLASDSDRAVTLRTAVRQLEPRLAAFVRYFVAAIESDCRDEEAVHQLRVLRRASAAIAMFSELLPAACQVDSPSIEARTPERGRAARPGCADQTLWRTGRHRRQVKQGHDGLSGDCESSGRPRSVRSAGFTAVD